MGEAKSRRARDDRRKGSGYLARRDGALGGKVGHRLQEHGCFARLLHLFLGAFLVVVILLLVHVVIAR
jgi:hypothetical protein